MEFRKSVRLAYKSMWQGKYDVNRDSIMFFPEWGWGDREIFFLLVGVKGLLLVIIQGVFKFEISRNFVKI